MTRALLLVLLPACSALVDASGVPVRCEADQGCPSGQRCVDGVCEDFVDTGCVPGADEICDGRDNNCVEGIDEGHDIDEDGATWCGGGVPSARDCNDDDPRRFPGAAEVCDGADNDCDSETDEDACPDGEACDAFAGVCEPFDCRRHPCPLDQGGCNEATGVCDAPDCRDDGPPCADVFEVCDPFSGLCVNQQGPLGSPCTSHVECLSVFCLDPNVARLDSPQSLCSRLCCSNDDCPPDFVCWASGSGVSACVAREVVDLGVGGAIEGAACDEGADCASGLCGDGACATPCCTQDDCPGDACGLVLANGRDEDDLVLACRASDGGGFDEPCFVAADCATGLCLAGRCTRGCCDSPSCGEDFACSVAFVETKTINSYFRVCVFRGGIFGGIGFGEVGEECAAPQDCRSTQCEPDDLCTDSCCADEECPDGWACRPRTFRQGFATACVQGPG